MEGLPNKLLKHVTVFEKKYCFWKLKVKTFFLMAYIRFKQCVVLFS